MAAQSNPRAVFKMSSEHAKLTPPSGRPLIIHVVVNIEYWAYDQPTPRTIVVPPHGTRQRRFERILGHYRLNIGNGYGIHGTQEIGKLGRNVSHGCVRLSDPDIERLFALAKVGDRVIIY